MTSSNSRNWVPVLSPPCSPFAPLSGPPVSQPSLLPNPPLPTFPSTPPQPQSQQQPTDAPKVLAGGNVDPTNPLAGGHAGLENPEAAKKAEDMGACGRVCGGGSGLGWGGGLYMPELNEGGGGRWLGSAGQRRSARPRLASVAEGGTAASTSRLRVPYPGCVHYCHATPTPTPTPLANPWPPFSAPHPPYLVAAGATIPSQGPPPELSAETASGGTQSGTQPGTQSGTQSGAGGPAEATLAAAAPTETAQETGTQPAPGSQA